MYGDVTPDDYTDEGKPMDDAEALAPRHQVLDKATIARQIETTESLDDLPA